MAGVSLVGLAGSLIKDAVREDANVFVVLKRTLADLPNEDSPELEPIPNPAATKVLLGVFITVFAQVLYASLRFHA
jgi:hypothetical protein